MEGWTEPVPAQAVNALRITHFSIRPADVRYVVGLLYEDKYFSVAVYWQINSITTIAMS